MRYDKAAKQAMVGGYGEMCDESRECPNRVGGGRPERQRQSRRSPTGRLSVHNGAGCGMCDVDVSSFMKGGETGRHTGGVRGVSECQSQEPRAGGPFCLFDSIRASGPNGSTFTLRRCGRDRTAD